MRILGIDIGKKTIRAVELDAAFGRYEIHEYHEAPIAEGVEVFHVLRTLVEGLGRKPDRIVACLLSDQFTSRNLNLPTRDRKTIQSTLQFELEDEVPFSADDSILDFSVLSSSRSGSSVHVAITRQQTLKAFLTTLNPSIAETTADSEESASEITQAEMKLGIDPDIVTSEGWAYRSVLNRIIAPDAQEQPVLLVHIGNERSTLYVHWRGSSVLCRPINWGGQDLTLAICKRYQVPMDQAEKAKIDNGFVLPSGEVETVTPEQLEMSDTLLESFRELFQEIRQAKLTCKNLTKLSPAKIFFCGGTSLLPGLNRAAEEELKTPVETLRALSSVTTSGVAYSEAVDASFLLSLGNALALVPHDKAPPINFRKGAFAKQGRTQTLDLSALKRPLQGIAAVTGCMMLSLCVQKSVYTSQSTKLDDDLTKEIKAFFPAAGTSVVKSYKSSTASLRSSVKKELERQRELNRLLSPNPRSPLDFLKTLSAGIPKENIVDLMHYQVGAARTAPYSPTAETTAELTFYYSNPTTAERLTAALNAKLSGVKMSTPEDAPPLPDLSDPKKPGKEKRLKATFTGKPLEASYGK